MPIVLKTVSDSQQARQDLAKLRESVDGIKASTEKVSGSFITLGKSVAALASVSFAAKGVMALSDSMTLLENRIKIVTNTQKEFNSVFAQVKRISMETRSDLGAIGKLYTKLNLATKDMGANQKQVSVATATIAKAMLVSGASAEEAKNSIQQLGQAMASGKLAGDEFRSVMENAPELANAIAKGMGVTLGKMYELRDAGKLTARDVFQAILKQQDAINAKFGKLNITYGEAFKNLGNSLILLFDSVKKTLFGSSDGLSRFINNIALGIADFAENFRINLARARVAALIFAYDVIEVFNSIWGEVKEGPASIYENFKKWLGKVSPILAGLLTAVELYSGQISRVFGKVLESVVSSINTNGLFSTMLSYARTASQAISQAINSIFKGIKQIRVSNIFPDLGVALDYVRKWAIRVERWFFWLYDQVIGHSWIPDLVKGTTYWLSKLVGKPLDIIKSFGASANGVFGKIRFITPFAMAIGAAAEFHTTLFKILGVVAAIAAIWAGVSFAKGKLDINVLTGSKVVEYLKGIHERLGKYVSGDPNAKDPSKRMSLFNRQFGDYGIVRAFKQAFGIKDIVAGQTMGQQIDTTAQVGRGPMRQMSSRDFLHDVTNMFPPRFQFLFLSTMAGLFGTAIILATESGPVRAALLGLLGTTFVSSLVKNIKLSTLATQLQGILKKFNFNVDFSKFNKTADSRVERFSGPTAVNDVRRMVRTMPEELKVPLLATFTAVIGAAIIGATSAGTFRSVLLSVLTTGFGLSMGQMVHSSTIHNSFASLGDIIVKAISLGLYKILNDKSVVEDPFGFLTLAAKTSLLFESGRKYFGQAALGAVTAPTNMVRTTSDAIRVGVLNRQLGQFEKIIEDHTADLARATKNHRRAMEDLAALPGANGRRLGDRGARRLLEDGQRPANAAAAAAYDVATQSSAMLEQAQGNLQRAQSDPAAERARSLRDRLRGGLAEKREALRQGATNFASGAGGAVGAAVGLQIGAAIVESMGKNVTPLQKIGIEIGMAMAGQAVGAAMGAMVIGIISTAMSLVGMVLSALWTRIAATQIATAVKQGAIQVAAGAKAGAKAAGGFLVNFLKALVVLPVVLLAAIVKAAAMFVLAVTTAALGISAGVATALLAAVAIVVAGIAIAAYVFWEDLKDPRMWSALGTSIFNIMKRIQLGLANVLLDAGLKVYNWLRGLIGLMPAQAAEIKKNLEYKPTRNEYGDSGMGDYQRNVRQPRQDAKDAKDREAAAKRDPNNSTMGKLWAGLKNGLHHLPGTAEIWEGVKSLFTIPSVDAKDLEEPKVESPEIPTMNMGAGNPTSLGERTQAAVKSLTEKIEAASPEAARGLIATAMQNAGFDAKPEDFSRATSETLMELADPLNQIAALQQRMARNPGSVLAGQAASAIKEYMAALQAKADVAFLTGELNAPLSQTGEGEDSEDKKKKKREKIADAPVYTGLKAGDMFNIFSEMLPELQVSEEQFKTLTPSIARSFLDLVVNLKKARDDLNDKPLVNPELQKKALDDHEKQRQTQVEAAMELAKTTLRPFQMVSKTLEELQLSDITEQVYDYAQDAQRQVLMAQVLSLKNATDTLNTTFGTDEGTAEIRRAATAQAMKLRRAITESVRRITEGAGQGLIESVRSSMEAAGVQAPPATSLAFMTNEQLKKLEESMKFLQEAKRRLAEDNLGEEERKLLAQQILDVSDVVSEELAKLPENKMKRMRDAGANLAGSIHTGLTESLTSFLTGKGLKLKSLLDKVSTTVISTVVNGLMDPITGENGVISRLFKSVGERLYATPQSVTGGLNQSNMMRIKLPVTDSETKDTGFAAAFSDMTLPSLDVTSPLGAPIDVKSDNLLSPMKSVLNAPVDGLSTAMEDTALPLAKSIDTEMPEVSKSINALTDCLDVPAAGQPAGGVLGGLGGGLEKLLGGLLSPGGLGSIVGMLIGGLFAEGGLIRGPGTGTSDSILIGASTGEFVMNAKSTKQHLPLLTALNAGKIPKFATGGLVGGNVTATPTLGSLNIIKPENKSRNTTTVNLTVTGDISRQTKAEVYRMIPDIAAGVNGHNREKGLR